MWLFNITLETNTESSIRNRNMLQGKNKIKSLEKSLMKGVQCNDHKDAHWTWEKNRWTQWEFQQRDRKYKKILIRGEDKITILTYGTTSSSLALSIYRGTRRRRERERSRKSFEDIMAESFSNLGRETDIQLQEAQRIQMRSIEIHTKASYN